MSRLLEDFLDIKYIILKLLSYCSIKQRLRPIDLTSSFNSTDCFPYLGIYIVPEVDKLVAANYDPHPTVNYQFRHTDGQTYPFLQLAELIY